MKNPYRGLGLAYEGLGLAYEGLGPTRRSGASGFSGATRLSGPQGLGASVFSKTQKPQDFRVQQTR